jgi:integrase
MKLGLIGRNAADAVSRPKPQHRELKVLGENQVLTLLSVVKGGRYEALYYIALATGLRQGELPHK